MVGGTSTLNWVGEAICLSVDQSWLGADNNHIAINNDVGNEWTGIANHQAEMINST